ncbi:Hint domain-containing protein [uncultured Roseobacter sp.]|uniref:Hint domain-containing protein n=1 Tax=uncultured Roseobacter sp. TaxID=114847 RepID=UPI00261827CA|nr:Hint domain-containing protein [uncultured Roseobacter sp.]
MPVFLRITDADIQNPSFWAALTIDRDSTLDTTQVDDRFQIVLTGTGIRFTDTTTGAITRYDDGDLTGGSFSQFVQFLGNDADNAVSGSVGLNARGYIGGAGNDTFTDDGALGGTIEGGAGNDVLTGGSGSNNIRGQDGDDILRGGASNNNLYGGNGNDTLFAEEGSGTLQGGRGDDTIIAGLNTGFVNGGPGNDSLTLPEGSVVNPFSPTGGNVTLPNGRSFTYLNINSVTVPCFAAGTPLCTPGGEVAVEELAVGDLVETADHGAQPIRWIGSRRVPGLGKLAPVRFAPGSIGNTRAIRLSPQHRVLLSGWRCEMLLQAPEVLCAAAHLIDGAAIRPDPCEAVTYYHVMFDRHEVVFSGGAQLESFYAGDYILEADHETYSELLQILPELQRGKTDIPAARPILRRFEAAALRGTARI